MTVTAKDAAGAALYEKTLEAVRWAPERRDGAVHLIPYFRTE